MFTKADIEKYFIAEKNESLLFLVLGVLAISLSIFFYSYLKTNFYKGAAAPLLLIGLIQAVAGYAVYARSDQQRIEMVYAYDMNPGKLKSEEVPRMNKVNRDFVIYRWVEIGLLAIGIMLIFLNRSNPKGSFWLGLGITLAIQAAIALGADYFAEKRAKIYCIQLENFSQRQPT
ncbi:MAG: hypothetical protein ACHQEM_09140 [Chitinophagales bacterium]